jgi:hypothetical protein
MDLLAHNGPEKPTHRLLGQTTVGPLQAVCQGKLRMAVIQDRIQWNLAVCWRERSFLDMWVTNDFCSFAQATVHTSYQCASDTCSYEVIYMPAPSSEAD